MIFTVENRKEKLKTVIEKGLMDKTQLEIMIDWYVLNGKLAETDGTELLALLNPETPQ